MNLTWYYYFSYWIFIWFLIFKMGLIKYSPYFVYVLTVTFIMLKFFRDIFYFNFKDKKEIKNKDLILAWFLLALILDIIPFFFLDKQLDKESIYFTVLLALVYVIFMNKSNINIINHYTVVNYREFSDKYESQTFFKNFFSLT